MLLFSTSSSNLKKLSKSFHCIQFINKIPVVSENSRRALLFEHNKNGEKEKSNKQQYKLLNNMESPMIAQEGRLVNTSFKQPQHFQLAIDSPFFLHSKHDEVLKVTL